MSERGINLSAIFRSGTSKRYERRPPANCIAARRAWDEFAKGGPVGWVQLLDGYWGCQRPDAPSIEEIEAVQFRREWWLPCP